MGYNIWSCVNWIGSSWRKLRLPKPGRMFFIFITPEIPQYIGEYWFDQGADEILQEKK